MSFKTLALAALTASVLAACSSTQAPADTSNGAANNNANAGQTVPAIDPLKDPASPLSKRSVFFDYDSSVVKGEYKPTVEAHAGYLKAHAERSIQIQGNTDVRGSREYNVGLGQRRAEAVKKSLTVLGVSDKQVEAVSFGKEKPRSTGSSDADHADNRRADVVYNGEQ